MTLLPESLYEEATLVHGSNSRPSPSLLGQVDFGSEMVIPIIIR